MHTFIKFRFKCLLHASLGVMFVCTPQLNFLCNAFITIPTLSARSCRSCSIFTVPLFFLDCVSINVFFLVNHYQQVISLLIFLFLCQLVNFYTPFKFLCIKSIFQQDKEIWKLYVHYFFFFLLVLVDCSVFFSEIQFNNLLC